MRHSRRRFVQLAGGALSAGALADGIETATAAEKPPMRWDPAHDSNYTSASRTASDVRWIVMHTIEGSASAGINWFKNPDADVSSHFVVDADGSITKMVGIDDVAWTQGNGEYNDTGISIELAGYANQTDFSAATYEATGQLVAYLCEEYGVPKRHPTYDVAPCSAYDGEGGVVGHDQIPSPYDCSEVTGGKVDPGSTWNWSYFMDEVGGSTGGGGRGFAAGDAVATTGAVNVRSVPASATTSATPTPRASAASSSPGRRQPTATRGGASTGRQRTSGGGASNGTSPPATAAEAAVATRSRSTCRPTSPSPSR